VLQCVAVCCSVVQCVAVCCSVLQCVAACCSVLQRVAVCSVLQCVAACCSVVQRVADVLRLWHLSLTRRLPCRKCVVMCRSMLLCGVGVLQRVVGVFQCVAV